MNYLNKILLEYLERKIKLTGIKFQLVVPTLVIAFSTILALGIILGTITIYTAKMAMDDKGNAVAEFLTKVAHSHIANHDLTALQSFVNQLQKNSDVAHVVFTDKDNKVLTESINGNSDVTGYNYLAYERNVTGPDNSHLGIFKIVYKKDALLKTLSWTIFGLFSV